MSTKATLVVVRSGRPYCGVSYWADRLAAACESLGASVEKLSAKEYAARSTRRAYDGAIVNVEVGADTKSGDLFRALRALGRSKLPPHRRVVVLHSVFRPGDLRLPPPLAKAAVAYQWLVYRYIARYATVVVLSEEMQRRLADHGVRSRVIELGSYTDANDRTRDDAGETLLIGLIGHPYAAKHYEKAVEAFEALSQTQRRHARIVVVGGDPAADPEGAATLRRAIGALPADQVTVTGVLSDTQFAEWLDRLDIALLPYEERASSSSVLSHVVGRGIPSIVTPTRIFDRVVECGGALVARDWPSEATALLDALLADRKRLDVMRAATKQLAATGSISGVAQRFLEEMQC